MIYCPKCGTANRDGSRFCNECGEELGTQTRVKCPHCGTLNPVQNWFCSECRGRLFPSLASTADTDATPTIKGLSLPTKTPLDEQDVGETMDSTPESDDGIPAWLRELGASLSEEEGPAGADSLEDASEIPDWLRDLRDSLPGEPESEVDRTEQEERPAWLSEPQPPVAKAPPSPPSFDVEEETGTERMDELEPLSAEAKPLSEAGEEEMPDWLAELRSSISEPESVPTVPEAEVEPAPPPVQPEEEPAPELEGEPVPDWLAQLRAEEPEAEREEEPAPEVEVEPRPDWLAQPQAETPEAEAEPASLPVQPEEEPAPELEGEPVPDWLAQLRAEEPEAEREEEPAPEVEEEPLPDWLAQPQAEAPEAEAEPAPPPVQPEEEPVPEVEEEPVPDWLAQLRAEEPEAEREEEPAPELEGEPLPDWLAQPQAEAPEAEAEPAPPPVQPEEEPVPEVEEEPPPDWLAELRAEAPETEPEEVPDDQSLFPPIVIEAEPGPAPEADVLEEGEIPDWLAEFAPVPSEEGPVTAIPIAEEEFPVPEEPDWLAELQKDLGEAELPSEEALTEAEAADWLVPSEPDWEDEEGLALAEIPAWLLALKPAELREEEEAEEAVPEPREPMEETGILTGLQGTLPVEMVIAQPRAVTAVDELELPIVDTPQARLFAEVVSRPPESAPTEIVTAPSPVLAPLSRWIIYILLIAVVSLPLLLGEPLLTHTVEAPESAIDLHDAIGSLGSNAPVLVAFDYDPTTSGEMDVLAQALVGHLMDQGARVVAISLLPAGPATAQSVLDRLATERVGYADSYGQRYANLGYLPGQATAVRLLGLSLETALPQDFQGTPLDSMPVMQGLNSIRDFDLIVELAATQDTLRSWVEQASTPYAIPLGAGVSASVDPLARPYYQTESQQLLGLIGGVPGVAAYEALRSGQDEPTDATAVRLDSQLAGHLVLVLVLLVGNAIYLARRGTGRKG
jgi:hypothetical protein